MLLLLELRNAFARSGGKSSGLVFLAMAMMMFPLAAPAGTALPPLMAHAVLWISLAMAYALSSRDLFDEDLECGALEQYALMIRPFSLVFLAKTAAHILLFTLPSALTAPALLLLLDAKPEPLPVFLATLGAGSLCALICAVIGALTAGAAKRGGLTSALLLPLLTPALIFGAACSSGAGTAREDAPLMLAVALLALTPVCAALGSLALKCHVESA